MSKVLNYLLLKNPKMLDFIKKSEGVVFFFTLLFCLFYSDFLSAQNNYETGNDNFGQISLKDAAIYSNDKDFSQQIKHSANISNQALFSVSNKNFSLSDNQVGNGAVGVETDFSGKNIETPNEENSQVGLILLRNGTQIYSNDKDFNQQIEDKKIVFDKASISEINIADRDYLIISSKGISQQKFNASGEQVGNDALNKSAYFLKKIKKEISEYEKRKVNFIADHLECWPSSGHFSGSKRRNADCISYRTDNKDYSKIFFLKDDCFATKALNHLYTQNFTYYNNKSLDYCFSKVFSVRPPPVLV